MAVDTQNVAQVNDSAGGDHTAFSQLVRQRHSVRAFQSTPMPQAVIEAVLDDARWAPSNGNTQPWVVHIVSGAARDRLSTALVAAASAGKFSLDFSFSTKDYGSPFVERYEEQASHWHAARGVVRDDAAARMALALENYRFFGAPHVALLFMPSVGDGVRAAADVGMYAQTLLLALAARGLGGVPQTSVGMLAASVREELGVPDDFKLLFAVSFGYPDNSQQKLPLGRASLEEAVTFHS